METLVDVARSAERILVPSSKDSGGGITAFTDVTGIEIPADLWENMVATSQGREFRLAKGADMPGQVWAGWADIAIASTELQLEFGQGKTVGLTLSNQPVCRYSVIALEGVAREVQELLTRTGRYPIAVKRIPATFPRTLNYVAAVNDLPLAALDVPVTGKGEATMRASGVGMMAERVVSGNSARKVGAVEAYKLLDLFPMMLIRRPDA